MKKLSIDCKQSNQFTPLAISYLYEPKSLSSLWKYSPDTEDWDSIINNRRRYSTDRKLLVDILLDQYESIDRTNRNELIKSLADENTFTVCTAHQPLIFTGHAYFIHKILHCIHRSETLAKQYPDLKIIPIFYIGSEDEDWDEIGNISLDHREYRWRPENDVISGKAVIDDKLESIRDSLKEQMKDAPQYSYLAELLDQSYQKKFSLGQATRMFIDSLFEDYDILVIDGDEKDFKARIKEAAKLDLLENKTEDVMQPSLEFLSTNFKVQAMPQVTNFFYLKDDHRLKIVPTVDGFQVDEENLSTKDLAELIENQIENFSPNVIYRPILQESILPNLAFIGGAGEVSYWLELKPLFERLKVPMPLIEIRKSVGYVNESTVNNASSYAISFEDAFADKSTFLNNKIYATQFTTNYVSANNEWMKATDDYLDFLSKNYPLPENQKSYVQKSIKDLEEHLKKKIEKQLRHSNTKMIAAYEDYRSSILPTGKLQERGDTFLPLIASYGKKILDEFLELFEDDKNVCYLILD